MCRSVRACSNWAVIRTRVPERMTDPSTMPSTLSSLAISGSVFFVPLYCIAEVRETTRRVSILDRFVISVSVMPSAKYSCSGSRERFSSGSTARDRMVPGSGVPKSRWRSPPTFVETTTPASSARAMPATNTASPRLCAGREAPAATNPDPESRLSLCRSVRMSEAFWKRCLRSFSSALLMISSSFAGTSGFSRTGATGTRFRIASVSKPEVSPRKGRTPVTIS